MNARYTDAGQPSDGIAQAAAEWVLRRDRGLTANEQDAFLAWLAADPSHRLALAVHENGWDELDRLIGLQMSVNAIPDPDLLRREPARLPRSASVSSGFFALAAGAAIVFGVLFWRLSISPSAEGGSGTVPAVAIVALIEQRELSDGSVIELNRGAVITEDFNDRQRRVRLVRGEAHFKVAKDVVRPFLVEVGSVTVQAVGTAFNVRLESGSVEVIVTEGKVHVSGEDGLPMGEAMDSPLLVSAGERTLVSFARAKGLARVAGIDQVELEARLAWQPRLLDFTNASLREIVAEFNHRNPVRVTLKDESLGDLRLSATFRSDNVEGFLRLMASDFGMRVERPGEGEILLTGSR